MTQTSLDKEERNPKVMKDIWEEVHSGKRKWLGDAFIYMGDNSEKLWDEVRKNPDYYLDQEQQEITELVAAKLPDLICSNVEGFNANTPIFHIMMGPGDAAEKYDLELTKNFNDVTGIKIVDLNPTYLDDAEQKSRASKPGMPVTTHCESIYKKHDVPEGTVPVFTMFNVLGNFSGESENFPEEDLQEKLEQIHTEGGIYFITLDSTDNEERLARAYPPDLVTPFLLDPLRSIGIEDEITVTSEWDAVRHCLAHNGESEKYGKFGIVPGWRPPTNIVEKIAEKANYDHIRTYGVNGMKMYILKARTKVESLDQCANDNQISDINEPLAAPSV